MKTKEFLESMSKRTDFSLENLHLVNRKLKRKIKQKHHKAKYYRKQLKENEELIERLK